MANPAQTVDQNLLPVQAYFSVDGTFQTFIGQGQPFYATVNPFQSGLTITNSTINSTTIGATTPSTGVFTNVTTTTGTIYTTPANDTDIANKAYVDATSQGLSFKQPAKYTTTGNITLSGLATQGGGDWPTALTAGMRILVKNQTSGAENGIYLASATGWTRSLDANTWNEIVAAYLFITSGTVWAGSSWVDTNTEGGTLGTTPVTFVQFSNNATYTAGTGLTLAGYQFSITPVGTAGTYGSASQVPVFVTNASGQVTSVTNTNIAIAGSQITSGTIDTARISGSYTGITGVGTLTAGTWNASTIGVAYGGTGAVTLTGYVKGGGTTPLTASTTIPNTDITGLGTMSTQNANSVAITGGSAALTSLTTSSLTGYLYGNAGSAVTASTTIPTSALSGNFVSTFSAGTTGLTPNTNTTGAITLAGTLAVANGGTGVTSSSGANSVVLRDANGNITTNCLFEGYTTQAASGTTITLTASTAQNYQITGSGGQTIKLPDATTLPNGALFTFNNNQSSGAITVVNNSSTTIATIQSGGYVTVVLLSNSTAAGSWDRHDSTPSNVSWSTNTLDYAGSITSATWNGNVIAINRGGTNGTATPTAGGIAYGSGTAYAFTTVGSTGQVLTSNGSGTPTWTSPASSITLSDDTTTNATRYPLFANATSGTVSTEYVSSTKYQFNPSTGVLTSTSFSGAGTGLTGTASSLSIGGNAATATSATTATNIAGGANGSVPYQTGSGATTFLAAGTNGYVMTLAGGVPTWAAAASSGITISDDTTTNATRYLTFTSATSGSIISENVSSTKLQFNPSTGNLISPIATHNTLTSAASTSLILQSAGTTAITVDTSQNTTFAKSIILSGSTSGTTTLASTAVAGTSTATFPSATGTVMVSGNMPAFSATSNATQALSNNVYTKVSYQTKTFDTNSNFDNTTNYRFLPTVAGYYQINVQGSITASSSVVQFVGLLYKNGSGFGSRLWDINPSSALSSNGYVTQSGSSLIYMNGTTDYLECYEYVYGASATLTTGTGSNGNVFSGILVRSA